MRNPETFILIAFGIVLFMAAMAVLLRRLRLRRATTLLAERTYDAAALSRLENEGGHSALREHTS